MLAWEANGKIKILNDKTQPINKYAPEIRTINKKYKNKNDRQTTFKEIKHSLM